MLLYIFYIIISPILYFFISICRLFSSKIAHHLKHEKQSLKDVKKHIAHINNKKVILLHAASAGEFEQIKPLLRKIDKDKYCIVQSFTSPTIYKKEKNNPLIDVSCYHPFDFVWKSYLFFKTINPSKYIITRHDVWPVHMLICKILQIPCYYINANIHKNSIWSKKLFKSFSKLVLSKFTDIYAPSERIKNLLTEILGDDLLVAKMGDTRFDQIIYRKSNNKKNLLPNFYNNSNNVIFGSYDDYDEKIIVKSLERVFPNGDEDLKKKNIGIILVPHEINQNKINMLIRQLKNQSIECNTLSNSADFKSNVIIIDTVGILADLYKYTKLAYVGSGFTTGVHSVIEPAVYGCTIGHGPNFELLDEAKEMQKNNISYILKSTTDMVDFINYIDNKNKLFNRNKVIDFISQSSGTTDKIIQRMGL